LGRYLEAYQQDGLEGLKPSVPEREAFSALPENYSELLDEAITLRRENPTRSISDIIRILELEGRTEPGILKRPTLQRHMQEAGYSSRQVMMYQKKGKASRRFQKEHRCELWQSDFKYGPYLPIGLDGQMKQVYLCVFIDDATRYIVSAGFYAHQDTEAIEHCLRQAIMRYGKPDCIYVDNGKPYRSQWITKACAKLGIRLIHAKPYNPEGKGKIEAFNHRIDSFLSEAALQKARSLTELNESLEIWIDGYYHKNVHRSLGEVSPGTAFTMDTRPLQFVDGKLLAEAFLHAEEREVDKIGCISFRGRIYEVGTKLMGRKVEILYDPACLDEIEIHHKDFDPFFAKVQRIDSWCGTEKTVPPQTEMLPADSSRLLDALTAAASDRPRHIATSFRYVKDGDGNV
jgi:transposase InsO family protein